MMRWPLLALLAVLAPLQPAPRTAPAPADGPAYTATGELKLPANYREWVFLTSGLDMSYTSSAAADHSMFDNVFVNPSAYRSFKETGTWPEGTTLVLENRGGEGSQSINKRGRTQSAEVMGLEVHVKDSAHIKGGWGFFGFENPQSAKLIARPADCYTCHEAHAAVDTTFVQFYPTLMDIAKSKGTLSEEFVKENPSTRGQ